MNEGGDEKRTTVEDECSHKRLPVLISVCTVESHGAWLYFHN